MLLEIASLVFLAFMAIGLMAFTIEVIVSWRYVRKAAPKPTRFEGISILKPLCGVDDSLEENLRIFADLDYPNYELLLGVRNEQDPAYPLALEASQRWPDRVRLFLQEGEPGLNPKVNQLITLAKKAQHGLLLISDSNVQVDRDYLQEIAARFEDPEVALVTNPVSARGEVAMGSLLDHHHLATSVACGMISAKVAANQDIVVGKSMALRRSDLDAIGGFEAVRNHLAEDYVLGRWVSEKLGKKVSVCQRPIYNVSSSRSLRDFIARYVRWAVIQRTAVAPLTYLGQGIINPLPWGILALALHPTATLAVGLAAAFAFKVLLDVVAIRLYRPRAFGLKTPLVTLGRDVLVAYTWVTGLFNKTVKWRGTRLRVLPGTILQAPTASQGGKVTPLEPAMASERRPAPMPSAERPAGSMTSAMRPASIAPRTQDATSVARRSA